MINNKSLFSQIKHKLSKSHWDILSIIIVSLLASLINLLSANIVSPSLLRLWERIRDAFYLQPSIAITTVVALLSITFSLATAIIQTRRVKVLKNATKEVVIEKGVYTLTPPEPPLTVFISSSMKDLLDERQVVADVLSHSPFTKPILFENIIKASESWQDILPTAIKKADIFLLIIGEKYSPFVEEEYRAAVQMNKPILVFVKKGGLDSGIEVSVFLKKTPVLWQEFTNSMELRNLVQNAIASLLLNSYRQKSV